MTQKDSQLANPMPAFGIMDAGRSLLFRADGLPIKTVAAIYAGTLSIVSFADAKIREPRDLEGRSLGLSKGGGEYASLPMLAANSGLRLDRVKLVDLSHGDGVDAVLAGRVDAYAGFYNGSIQDVVTEGQRRGKGCSVIRYADYGVGYYNGAIVANEAFLRGEAVVAADFIRQTLRALAWTLDNPEAALDVYRKYHPEVSADLARNRYLALVVLLDNPDARAHGLGWMTRERWTELRDAMLANGTLRKPLAVEDAFTTEFLREPILPKTWTK